MTLGPSRLAPGFGAALAFLIVSVSPVPPALAQSKPASAVSKVYVDLEGAVHIIDASGQDVPIPKEKAQQASSQTAIADDQRTVGWLAEFPNCCTSYPIALSLIVYRSGRIIHRFGDGMLIANWRFLNAGKQIAFYSHTVHGDFAPHYELRDVQTGRLLGKWDGPLDPKSPRWAKGLDQ